MTRLSRLLPFLAVALAGLLGCGQPTVSSGPSRAQELEMELKHQRDLLAQARNDIVTLRGERTTLAAELDQARTQISGLSGPEPGAFRFIVARVSLGWLTASVDWDNQPPDDGIQAFVAMEDQTGDSIKRAASFRLELYDLGREKESPIETWSFTPEAAAKYWNSIPSGYLFKLPYSNGTPAARDVILVARVDLSEGGSFQATRSLRVHR